VFAAVPGSAPLRPLGRSGLAVSEIGFGAWQLGNPMWNGPDRDASLALVAAALDRGVTFFDTAPGYGAGISESLLGEALEGRRDDVVICTKFGHGADGSSDFSAERLRPSLEESLTRLRTDHVDVLLLHSPPPELMDGSAPQYAELERLQREGLVVAYGVSLDFRRDLEQVLATSDVGVVEVLLNAFHQEPLPAVRQAAEQGVGVIVKVPLDSGWLGGRYDAASRFDDVRSRWSAEDVARRAELVEGLRALLPQGLGLATAALRFLLAQPISTIIPGIKSVPQLAANLEACDEPLPAEVVQAIEAFAAREIPEPLPW
jgi:aryl-alcohol dehydrogenase-like predicted oxidoreductase